MEGELASLKTDMEHVKKATEEIKIGVAEIITQIGKMSVDAESLRGRIREAEHDIISIKKDIERLRDNTDKAIESLKAESKRTHTLLYKYGIILVMIGSGATVGAEKILKIIFT